MRLLLDAHALLWWLADDPQLGPEARRLIADPDNEVLVSAATAWEISIKRSLGKLEAPSDIAATLADEGMREVAVLAVDGDRAGGLDPLHRDPFARMLVVQAARLDAHVVTHDPAFGAYGARVIPADR